MNKTSLVFISISFGFLTLCFRSFRAAKDNWCWNSFGLKPFHSAELFYDFISWDCQLHCCKRANENVFRSRSCFPLHYIYFYAQRYAKALVTLPSFALLQMFHFLLPLTLSHSKLLRFKCSLKQLLRISV